MHTSAVGLTDRLMPVLGRSRARRAVAMGGLPGLPLLSLGTSADNSHLTVACLTLALGLLWLRVGSRSPRLTESQTDPV